MEYQTTLSTEFSSIITPIQLVAGKTAIRFHLPEVAEHPGEVTELMKNETRLLSGAVQDIQIVWPIEYEYGTPIIFGIGGTTEQYQLTGWSHQEDGFTWTDGHNALLALQPESTDTDLTLTVTTSPYLGGEAIDRQRVFVTVNDHPVGEWVFDEPGIQEKSIIIPHGVLNERMQYIAFEMPDAVSPKDLGQSGDQRDLAIAVRSMVINC
ncbi:hypothetical protein D5R95_08720 [Methanosalsum natronophilum]|uniref:Uncharacterized protein n=1 Tax=Methanosalsum natronophilum TaxID=768733 RepID=A0A3R7WAR7_9EURY|nr:MAG: hypothetical protein D5R95_08720 [Methanosalsum natronophilum]